jgi:hypothetical protein
VAVFASKTKVIKRIDGREQSLIFHGLKSVSEPQGMSFAVLTGSRCNFAGAVGIN